MAKFEVYKCEVCGNMLVKVRNGGGPLVCCGQPMTLLDANTEDASQEKHVPHITKEDGRIKVQIGSELHPSIPEHYIEWIALVTEDKVQITYLKPGMDAKADFEEVESGTVYEYCNLHGLWKADI